MVSRKCILIALPQMCCLGVLTANWPGGPGLLLERRLTFDECAQLCFSGLRWTDVIGLETLFEISKLLGCLTGERWDIGLFIPFSNRTRMSLGAFVANLSDCGFEQWSYVDTYRSYEGWDPWYPLRGIPSEPLLSYTTFRDPSDPVEILWYPWNSPRYLVDAQH